MMADFTEYERLSSQELIELSHCFKELLFYADFIHEKYMFEVLHSALIESEISFQIYITIEELNAEYEYKPSPNLENESRRNLIKKILSIVDTIYSKVYPFRKTDILHDALLSQLTRNRAIYSFLLSFDFSPPSPKI
jgi:hypothetical protein